MLLPFDRKKTFLIVSCAIILPGIVYFFYNLTAVGAAPSTSPHAGGKTFIVERGQSFRMIAKNLEEEKFIRSSGAFKVLAFLGGKMTKLKPGRYELSPASSTPEILNVLINGSHLETEVRIREGDSLYDIDRLLSEEGIIPKGNLIGYPTASSLEGKLFPDTYKFFSGSDVKDIIKKFSENFEAKALPILERDSEHAETNLILASLLEKEVPDYEEQRVVAGILKKRLKAGIPLQVDATICYAKNQRYSGEKCYPITTLDLKIDSPYNTYLYPDWPLGPIGSPGVSALRAALEPKESPYWYYLSDPKTGRTIFSETLEEHARNKVIYLKH